MKHLYRSHPQLILRAPTQPFTLAFDDATIEASLLDARFMEAVYLASPALHEECRKWQRGELTDARKIERLRATLTRYYVRTTSRCTPFGLFAGCAVAEWGPSSRLTLAPEHATRHTRLDMHYLCALAQQLAAHADIRPRLRYWPNTSLYQTGEEIRYVEHHYAHGTRVHQISAVGASPYLLQVLAAAQEGQPYPALVALLSETEADYAEAAQFIDELIQAQVLVHELEPTVTGEEFFYHLQAVLERVAAACPTPEVAAVARALESVRQQLHALDQAAVNSPAPYEAIMATLAPLGVPIEPGKLFQTDTVLGVADAPPTLATAVQTQLLDALELLTHLSPPPHSPRLDDFRRRFQARYEEREVPLLEALDNESGLSYTDYGKSSYSPLIHDLALPEAEPAGRAPRQSEVQQLMARKLRQAEREGYYSVEVTREELRGFAPAAQPLPPSLAVMFRVLDADRILLESIGGSSAANLLGRFAHAAPAVSQLVQELTEQEQAHNPAVAFAEISHLPASRVGNVLLRPCFRALEIPYLAQSALPAGRQVRVQDMRLSVQDGQLVLRSAKTGQRIIPRLSTAHNFSREALPVYQFLCDLQTQGLQPHLGFSWQSVAASAKFLPRLTAGQVVLEPAAWQLDQADFHPLLTASEADFASCFGEFRRQWQLPRLFTLADGDNELLVDADNALLVRVWLDTIRGRASVRLKEFLPEPAGSPARDAAGRPYAQQLIALLVRQTPCYAPPARPASLATEDGPREFALGSEWLYYKLYCGQKVADRILLAGIGPLTEELRERGLLDNWFFIRYADPDSHLRVRFHLPTPGRIGEVIRLLNDFLSPFSTSGALWKVQADTYRRELERYGSRSIGLAEALFGYQSTALLDMLAAQAELPEEEATENWLWGLGAMEELLRAFGYPLPRKLALLQALRDSFAREFAVDKSLKLQLDAKYRAARPEIQRVLERAEGAVVPAPLAAIAAEINALEARKELEVPKDQLLGAYLHMLLNRLIPAEARLHELVLYDFLARHYQSRQAVQKQR